MKKLAVTSMFALSTLAAVAVPGFAQSSASDKAKAFGEKLLYSVPIGQAAGKVVGATAGRVVGGSSLRHGL
jgi:predicted DNA repair protein MutK